MSTSSPIPAEYLDYLRALLGCDVPLEHVKLLRGTWIGSLFGRLGQHAVTFGRSVHFTPRADLDNWPDSQRFALIAHECYHLKQYAKLGFLPFMFIYWISRITIFVLRRPIWDHPMEMPAYDMQRLAKERWEASHPS